VIDPPPSDTEALRAALAAEQQARREAEASASGPEAMGRASQTADRQNEARPFRRVG